MKSPISWIEGSIFSDSIFMIKLIAKLIFKYTDRLEDLRGSENCISKFLSYSIFDEHFNKKFFRQHVQTVQIITRFSRITRRAQQKYHISSYAMLQSVRN